MGSGKPEESGLFGRRDPRFPLLLSSFCPSRGSGDTPAPRGWQRRETILSELRRPVSLLLAAAFAEKPKRAESSTPSVEQKLQRFGGALKIQPYLRPPPKPDPLEEVNHLAGKKIPNKSKQTNTQTTTKMKMNHTLSLSIYLGSLKHLRTGQCGTECSAGAERGNYGDNAAECGVGERRRAMRERGVFLTECGGLWGWDRSAERGKKARKEARKKKKRTQEKQKERCKIKRTPLLLARLEIRSSGSAAEARGGCGVLRGGGARLKLNAGHENKGVTITKTVPDRTVPIPFSNRLRCFKTGREHTVSTVI